MEEARYTLTFGGLTHDAAFGLMERIDAAINIDAVAVTINETDEALGVWETVAWFANETEAKSAYAALSLPAEIVAVEQRDWVRESLQGLRPVIAGRFYIHGSHDRAARRAGGISLEIDAGTAFGTGHHGTTIGCLKALDALLKVSGHRRILDVGTGTGVLALAAARVLRSKVVGTDIDAQAVRVAQNNFRANGIGPLLCGIKAAGLHDRRIHELAPYDLVFANILAKPLERLATGLSSIVVRGGHLVLSGLTLDQVRWIKAVYRSRGFTLRAQITHGNWGTLVLRQTQGRGQNIHAIGSGYAENV